MYISKFKLTVLIFFIFLAVNIQASDAIPSKFNYKQWMIGANSSGFIYPKSSWKGPADRNYNIKGSVIRKFLQYEKQGTARGINLGWTNNASAKTAAKRSKWFFSRKSNSRQPIRYGERIAIAWGKGKKPYIKYAKRNIGINLDWSKSPSYEWTFLGGKTGQAVKKGKDWVIIYNIKHKQPLMYFKRTAGGHIGWPDSKKWRSPVRAVGDGFEWVGEELYKELKRLTLVCKGDATCISKIKLYQGYMIQLRTGVQMHKLPIKYRNMLAPLYPQLKNLDRYRFGYSNHQPENNATTDCSKTYYNNRAFVNRLKQGRLSKPSDYIWLLHELQHYNQCKRINGRDRYALMWFRDLGSSVLKSGNLKKIHDNMPMEKEAFGVTDNLCKRIKEC